jgi:PAS domain S-box-containing protein
MIEVERSALIGTPFTRFVLREDQDIFYQHRQRLLETEKSQSCDLRLVKKNGHEFFARLECMVEKKSGDDSRLVRAAVSDITDRKHAEEKLRQSEKKYRPLVEFTHDWVWSIDVEGRITFTSEAVNHILGYEVHEVLGSSSFYFMHPEDKKLYERLFQQVVEHKRGWKNAAVRMIHKSGSVRFFESSAQPTIDAKGRLVGFTGIDRDITERKQAEEALKISRKNLLEEYNQRKILSKRLIDLLERDRHYIAMELHDNIGQILTALKINLEIIDDKLKPTDTELGSLIKTARKRAKQAIEDLNIIAQGLMPGILDALGLVSSLRTLLDEFREYTDLKIDFFNRNVPKRFDQEKELAIYRIVQEALNNIIKHAKAKNIYVSLLKKGNVLFLSVEDDGVGFDQDKEMKISKGKGPVGLVIMRERAMQLDGELTIESKMGKGTHLLVEIPI